MDLIDVHPRIVAALRKAKVKDVGYLLTLSAPDLQRITKLSLTDVNNLQSALADSIPRASCVTALQILRCECPADVRRSYLSTGCPVLDRFLRGGVVTPSLTEIAGESASGKTQLCLQLCLSVQLPLDLGGLDSGAIYICTEDAFPNRRLVQMSSLLRRRFPQLISANNLLTDRVYVEHAANWEDLMVCVSRKVPTLLAAGRIKLVIIDSVAGIFRGELEEDAIPHQGHSSNSSVRRAKRLCSLAGHLHRLAFQFNAPVVVVNQVSDVFGKGPTNHSRPSDDKTPALGLSWANMLSARLMMSRTNESVVLPLHDTMASSSAAGQTCHLKYVAAEADMKTSRTYEATVRAMEVIFAPHLPNSVCRIILDEEGVKGRG